MAITYVAKEREPTDIPLDAVFRDGKFDILPDVQKRDLFDIKFRANTLTITAGKYVGLVPLNDRVIIQVEPKMPIANMLAMLSAVGGDILELRVLERQYRTAATAPPQIQNAIVIAFLTSLERVEVHGLKKTYESVTEAGSALKGRIEFNDSVQTFWSGGRRHGAVYTYFDLTSDVSANRLLRYACHLALTHHQATGAFKNNVSALAHFEEMFARSGVRLIYPDSRTMSESLVREKEPVYRRAMQLAQLVVSGRGVDLAATGREVALPSFLVDMETMFERYVRHVLVQGLVGMEVLDGNAEGEKPLYDDRAQPPANPDVIIRPQVGHVVIGEVKYKASEGRDDVNQVLAYSLTYRSPTVVLILPAHAAADSGLSEVGRVGKVRVCRYRFNLAAPDLSTEERAIVTAFAKLAAA